MSFGLRSRSMCGVDPSGDRGRGAAEQCADGHIHEDVARVVNAGIYAGERDHRRGHTERHPQRRKAITDGDREGGRRCGDGNEVDSGIGTQRSLGTRRAAAGLGVGGRRRASWAGSP
jgi:hypothetical protein